MTDWGMAVQRELPRPVRAGHRLRVAVAALAAIALTLGLALPAAHADDLDDQKARIQKKLEQTKRELNHSSKELNQKVAALEAARIKLTDARNQLARTQQELAAADKRDKEMAAKLAKAQQELAAAKKAVADGMVKLEQQRTKVGAVVQSQWQQKTNLLPVAVLTRSGSTRDFQTRLQWSNTMFQATEAKVKELEAAQRALNAERQKLSTIEQQVATQRAAAAKNLETKKALELQAREQTARVAALVKASEQAKTAAAAAVAEDKEHYSQLQADQAAVEKRIKERIAAEKRRQAKLAAQKRAAEKRAADKRAQEQREARQRKQSQSSRNNNSGRSTPSAHHGFVFPVSGPITSPYGMRRHPVTGVYKLHDGTDFGAGCGTPIRAAYSGRVAEKYYNTAWGNRLVIDHGRVDGRYVSTAYNHAIRYTVGVGQRVSTGQVIGYVGTTGYSTGCHLHLNLYLDGSVSNPMAWY